MNSNIALKPKPPRHVSEYARACLTALAENGMGKMLSLGGAFGMAYYYEYRPTHDVDAWWENSAGDEDRRAVIQCLEIALKLFGKVRIRSWGDVFSVELIPAGQERVRFSFKIAQRSARLEKPLPAPWPKDFLLDSFPDLLASKMVALVERGAPRDFRDIYTLCQAGMTRPTQCWELWLRRQKLASGNVDPARARLAVQTHLARIAAHRPLDKILDSNERASALRVRKWFSKEFFDAIVD